MKFKKIISVLASALMLSSTIGFAAAASYPEPFVSGGTANSAVVVGANAAVSDWSAAIDVQTNLQGLVTTSSGTAGGTVTGEAAALFTSSTKIYANDSINAVRNVVTETELPTILADGSFSGDVDASITQLIDIGSYPRVTFEKQPTSDDDPAYGVKLDTSTSNYLYNASITFNKAVAINHSDSEGEDITLLGKSFTVAAATDATNLILLKEAEKVSLDTDNPTADVTVGGETYTVELISASDTSATIRVTDSGGASESKEVNEAASKKINGVTIAVQTADETNLKLSASVIVGAEKMTFTSGSSVTTGEDNTVIDGTLVTITGGLGAMTKMVVAVAAPSSDEDFIKPEKIFTDPVFGTFKVDFSGINIPDDSESTAREDISFNAGGDNRMQVKFTDHTGNEKTIMYAYNDTAGWSNLVHDTEGRNISVFEGNKLKRNEYAVVGNEADGHLIRISTVQNQSTGYSNDKVEFADVFTGDTYTSTITSEGAGTVTIGGKVYTVKYNGASTASEDTRTAYINQPDSTGATHAIIYPTIKTSKGAKLFFVAPVTVNLSNWDNLDGINDNSASTLAKIRFPDGDGYTDLDIAYNRGDEFANLSGATVTLANVNLTAGNASTVTIGKLSYNVTGSEDKLTVNLIEPQAGSAKIDDPAIAFFEEKDDNSNYEAIIATLEQGNTGDDGMGMNDVISTWGGDIVWDAITLASDSKKTKDADLYGTISLIDSGDSDQKTAVISYPDEQVYAQIYIAEEAAAITPGTTTSGAGGQILVVKDSEVSSVSGKNLIVVGGSCINTAAAKILGSETPLCTSAFTEKTTVGAGQYIIKTVASPYAAADSGKVAMLVAGYEAAETKLAVAKALEGAASDVDTSQVYPITSTTTTTTNTSV